MATQYDPIAKDASMNTTENPSRSIADVLAQELAAIASAVRPNAGNIPYDGTASGLAADDVQEAIDEVVNRTYGRDFVYVTGDGVKTFATILNELFALVDFSKVTKNTVIGHLISSTYSNYWQLQSQNNGTQMIFSNAVVNDANQAYNMDTFVVMASGSKFLRYTSYNGYNDLSSVTLANGQHFAIIY